MFTHLHVHSHFSFLESSVKIEDLVEAAAGLGMKALALTDKYVMSGAVQFYKLAKAKGIKPITGCEICLMQNNPAKHLQINLSHLTLLAKNKKGYENLCRLVSKSHAGSIADCTVNISARQYNKSIIPVVVMDDIKRFSEGIVCLSGCSKGRLSQLLKENNTDEAVCFARNLLDIFGHDLYIEIQRYKASGPLSSREPGLTGPSGPQEPPGSSMLPGWQRISAKPAMPQISGNPVKLAASALPLADPRTGLSSEALAAFSKKTKIPAVATNDVHYLSQNDYRIYRYLSKIRAMGTKIDPTGRILESDEHYLKSYAEMALLFTDIPAAIKNTQVIAEKCSFDFDLGKTILPAFKTPEGQSQEIYLAELCRRGLRSRFGANPSQKVKDRLSKELNIIAKTGFSGYFLIVADIAEFAYKNSIPICGKGSSAGSLVSYLLKISNVDPLENNLYFERFLNEERTEPPDIDIDVSSKDREKIWHYLRMKYGQESVARVSSFATTRPRASIRESGRILGAAKEDIDFIIKSAPGYNRFYTPDRMESSLKTARLMDPDDPACKKILSLSKDIGGYIRHVSMHPSAFIVSNHDLSQKLPLTLSETGEMMSQYDMNSIDDMGILKIDLINSLSLSLIASVVSMLKKKRGIKLDISSMPYDDKTVYGLMQKGSTLGVFQLESFGIRTLSRKIGPTCLNDITLLVSLYRPGPQQSGMVNNFIERKFGREKISYIHRDLEPILKETFGVILYQEQAMQVAIKIAGYSMSEADSLRKAMVNLSREKMLAQHQRFISGGLLRGYDAATVSKVYNLISKFASYGFVKAHAAAYAEISYKTCFLKHYYPAEFLATILTNNSGYYSKMQYLEEARRLGIGLELPDINRSDGFAFTVGDCGKSIRVPLASVRDLGWAGINCIIRERQKNGDFCSLSDFYYRTVPEGRITKTAIENLIKIGAFNFTGLTAKKLLIDFYSLKKLKKPSPGSAPIFNCRDLSYSNFFSGDFFSYGAGPGCASSIEETNIYSKNFSMEEQLATEARILGFYISAHPLRLFRQSIARNGAGANLITGSGSFYSRFKNYNTKKYCYAPAGKYPDSARYLLPEYIFAAGVMISKRIEKTKNNDNMMFCTMEDEDGMYEAVFFPDVYNKYIKTIVKDRFLVIKGRLHIKDNNISLIAKEAFSITSFKKNEELKKAEMIKEDFLAGIKNPWTA